MEAPMRYTVVLVPADTGGYVAYVPVIPGCVTRGAAKEEALAMAEDAAAALLADRAEHDEWIAIENPGAVVESIEVEMPTVALARY
jgi:predicted RNase H-like HicB family nuclease